MDENALAEEGHSKLLLASVRSGTGAADEVSKAHRSSGSSRSLRLCCSAASRQRLLNQKHRKRKRQPQRDDPAGRGDRARRTAAAGAHQKATSGLVSSMMEMSDAEDRQWASKLVPNSDLDTGINVHLEARAGDCATWAMCLITPLEGCDAPLSRLQDSTGTLGTAHHRPCHGFRAAIHGAMWVVSSLVQETM